MNVELHTVAIRDDGCFSVLLADGRPFAVTCERTFDDGLPVVRAGRHRCFRTFFNHGGYETFEIEVAGHSRVLFHRGSVETDSMACVLVAERFGMVGDKCAVLDSKAGLDEFLAITKDVKEFVLDVVGRP